MVLVVISFQEEGLFQRIKTAGTEWTMFGSLKPQTGFRDRCLFLRCLGVARILHLGRDRCSVYTTAAKIHGTVAAADTAVIGPGTGGRIAAGVGGAREGIGKTAGIQYSGNGTLCQFISVAK